MSQHLGRLLQSSIASIQSKSEMQKIIKYHCSPGHEGVMHGKGETSSCPYKQMHSKVLICVTDPVRADNTGSTSCSGI